MLGSLLKAQPSDEAVVANESYSPDDPFERTPVELETFLYNPEYLNLSIRLSSPQLEFVESLSNIFAPTQYTEGVLMAGQGSGKDTCSILIGLRIM